MSETEKEPKGVSRRAFLKGAAAVTAGLALPGLLSSEAQAQTTTESSLKRCQDAQDLALYQLNIPRQGLANLVSPMWYRNVIGEPAADDITSNSDLVTPKDLGNGYTSYEATGPNNSKAKFITDSSGKVVFKSVLFAPLISEPARAIDIQAVYASKSTPSISPAIGYDGMQKLTFQDIGVSLIGPDFSDWQRSTGVIAVEGFIGSDNPTAFPWVNADNHPQAVTPYNPQ